MDKIEFPNIKSDVNCYLIKTNNGKYYQNYLDNNHVTLYHFTVDTINNELINVIGNKKIVELNLFIEKTKENDFIIIPSRSNKEVSIGVIISSPYYIDNKVYRKIKWLKTLPTSEFNLIYRYLHLDHSIMMINDIKTNLLRLIYPYYQEEGGYHLIIHVEQKEGILYKSLFGLSEVLLNEIKDDNLQIKLALQSPGIIELISEKVDVILTVIKVIKLIFDLIKTKRKASSEEQQLLEKYYEYKVDKLQILPFEIDKNDDNNS